MLEAIANCQSARDFNAQIADRAAKVGITQQALCGPNVPSQIDGGRPIASIKSSTKRPYIGESTLGGPRRANFAPGLFSPTTPTGALALLLSGISAVDYKFSPGHKLGFIGHKIEHAVGDIYGLAEVADRMQRGDHLFRRSRI